LSRPPKQPALLLGVEIDRGSENLASIFLPKLEKLCEVLSTWAGGTDCAIVVLTNNMRRRDALRVRAEALTLPVIVEMLPKASGRHGLADLAGDLQLHPVDVFRGVMRRGSVCILI
jgi:hypothetical protein